MHTGEAQRDREARDIFLKALDKTSPDARTAFLEGACGSDVSLRSKVDALLAHHFEDSFLESGHSTFLDQDPTLAQTFIDAPGAIIGRYKLLQKIGEGGCGVVYVRAGRVYPAAGGLQDYQARHGHQGRHRPFRS